MGDEHPGVAGAPEGQPTSACRPPQRLYYRVDDHPATRAGAGRFYAALQLAWPGTAALHLRPVRPPLLQQLVALAVVEDRQQPGLGVIAETIEVATPRRRGSPRLCWPLQ